MPMIPESVLSGVLNQLSTARIYTAANDRGLIDSAIKTLKSYSGAVDAPVVVMPPVVTPTPAPVPTVKAPAKPWKSSAGLPFLFGLTADNGNAGWDTRSAFFGFPVDVVTAFHAQGVGKNTQYKDAGALARTGKVKLISYALLPAKSDNQKTPADGYTLANAAAGAYNAEWRQLGMKFVEWGMNDVSVIVRLGWESNGNWYSWSATDGPQWAAAYEHAVRSIKRGIVDAGQTVKVLFDLCYNLGTSSGSNWAVPESDTFDIISLDAYDFSVSRTAEDFQRIVVAPSNKPGLDDILALAKARGKLVGIPEFGAANDSASAHIEGIVDWAAKNADWVAYICVFDGGTGQHAFSSAPNNWAKLKAKLTALRA